MATNAFRDRIRKSIADQNLQVALDNNARRRRDGRMAAFASLPDHQNRRARAHAVKGDVISHLDDYLEQFTQNLQKNGVIVHRAQDAAEALQRVLEIVSKEQNRNNSGKRGGAEEKQPRAPLVAKSKSMVSEEINLNHTLEREGIRVVETDLGEYIVQLRGERPSHIITPAVHLRRNDVGRLFEEKLGLPYTEEISVLTDTARKVLREVFLTADVGISGVNFGMADTGTLCLVTNEGNGRMVTTLPRVHIALMGIERLLPSMDDLALFLSLLPRSATGQKLTVYTSLMRTPLPGQTRHIILLDNGRTDLRNSPLAESLYCIRCGACLNACPVFREVGGYAYESIYPGPIGSVVSSALIDPQYDYLAQASSLCGACKEACPVDIDLPGMLLRIRSGVNPGKEMSSKEGVALPGMVKAGLRLYRVVASSPRLFRFAQRVMGSLPLPQWMHLPSSTGWGESRDFPRPATKPFRARFHSQGGGEDPGVEKSRKPEAANPPLPAETDLAGRFTRELEAVGGKVIRTAPSDLTRCLEDFLHSRGIDRVLVDEEGEKILSSMTGVTPIREPDATAGCGVTGAAAGIAETGSVVLREGLGATLTASLLPETNLVFLRASMLMPTVEAALRLDEVTRARNAVIVTGPSRTADIEMTLTIGVHGPGELIVYLIDDSPGV